MVHFVRHDLCSCGSPKSPLRLGIMSQYLPDIFQTFMLTIWHTQKVPYACALDCANMAQIACKIGYFVSGQKCQLWHRQRTPFTQFFGTKICIHHIGTCLKGFWYSELILGPFEKMKVSNNSLTHQKSYCRTTRKKTWWLWRLHRYGCGQFYWTKLHIVHIHTY